VFGGDTAAHTRFVFQNNIAPHNDYGIIGSGTGVGQPSIDRFFPGSVIRRNVIVGGDASRYPRDNFFIGSMNDVGFIGSGKWSADPTFGIYRLSQTSRYRGAGSDGRDPGIDVDGLATALAVQAADPPSSRQSADPPAGRLRRIVPMVVFWAAMALLGYVYVGYGLFIFLKGMFRPRPTIRRQVWPRASIVVIAHDEAPRIASRIENLLSLDYPRDRLEILVASDGSTDGTVELLRQFEPAIRVIESPTRRGKAALLNEVIAQTRGEIVALADARQRFAPDALRHLAASFADSSVGAVSGELVLLPSEHDAESPRGVGLYWTYEKRIRQWESRVHSTVGATGAIYGIRRRLFEPIPEDTILDDVLIPLRIVRRGYRVIFEPRARAFDVLSATARDELKRKVRTIGGTFQLLARERWIWNPLCNRLWLQTLSHKALRLTVPLLHLAGLIANALLLDHWIYQVTMGGQALFYGSALVGCAWAPGRKKFRPLVVPYTIGLLGWATVVGFVRFVTGRQTATWDQAAVGDPSHAVARLRRTAPAAR
jgi:glycosyltransferase involved in cell wall biosynthesis